MGGEELRVHYTADASDVVREHERVARATDSLDKRLTGLGSRMQSVGTKVTQAGRAMTVGLTLPILALGAGALKTAIDFESAFAGVRKTVDATEPEFAALAAGFRNMAKEIPVSVNELARIGEAAGQLGIAKESILSFTRVVADMGNTTNLTADQAATAFGQIANVMGLAEGDFSRLGSAIVDLGNKGATTESQITEMALRIAGTGKVVGLTTADVLGLAAALANAGIEAEAGGTAISKTLREIATAVASGGADLRNFAAVAGVSAKQYADAFRTAPADATAAFITGLQRMSREGKNVFGVLAELGITESRQIDTLTRLANSQTSVADALNTSRTAWAENSALAEEAGKRYETTAAKLQVLKNKGVDALITLGQALIPILERAMPIAEKVIGFIARMAEAFAKLPSGVQTGIVAFAGFVAILGPIVLGIGMLITAVGSIIGAIGAVAPAFAAVGAAVGAVSVPVLIVIGVIAALVAIGYVVWRNWSTIVQALKDAWAGLKGTAIAVFNFLKMLFLNFTPIGQIIQHWQTIKDVLASLWNVLATLAKAAASLMILPFSLSFVALRFIITTIWDAIGHYLVTAWAFIASVATTVWNAITGFISSAVNVVRSVVTTVWNAIAGFLSGVWSGIRSTASSVWNAIVGVISGPVNTIRGIVTSVANTIRSVLGAAWDAIKSGASSAWNAIVGAFRSAYNTIAGIVSKLKATFCNLPFVPCSPIPLVVDANTAVAGVIKAFRVLERDLVLPQDFSAGGSRGGGGGGRPAAGGGAVEKHFHLHVPAGSPQGLVVAGFNLVRQLEGARR